MALSHGVQVRGIMKKLHKFSGKRTAVLAVKLVDNLRDATPKDTKWASRAWAISKGSFSGGSGFVKKSLEAPTERYAAASRQGASKRALKGYLLKQGELHVYNDTPHIEFLNDGWSDQAPAGFVQATIAQTLK